MKLRDLLEQLTVELNMPKPEDAYDFDDIQVKDMGYGNYYKYIYENIQGDNMEITNLVSPPTVSATTGKKSQPGKVIYIAFGLYEDDMKDVDDEDRYMDQEEEDRKYKSMTGAGDTIKVLATVVEATKQTMKKEGGEDNIYGIAFAPSDKKRKNIYDHYLGTLFPNFKKDEKASGGFSLFVNQNFKDKSLDEIGGDTEKMAPYRFKTAQDEEDFRSYVFKTDSGLDYQVDLEELVDDEYGMILDINFGVVDEEELTGPIQNLVTNKGELYRVMNTIAAIIREDLAINSYIKYITFNPAKRQDKDVDSNARGKLYMKYIQGRLPNAQEIKDDRYPILIKIK